MYVTYLYACYKVFTCDFILNSRKEILKKGCFDLLYIEIPTVYDKDFNFNSDLELGLVKCYYKGNQIYPNLSFNKHGIFYSHFIQFLPEYVTLAFV